MKRYFLCCLMISFMASYGQQKKADLSGRVKDATTGLPLAGASVMLVDSKSGTITDSTGRYSFRNISGGHFLMEISFTGYRSVIEHIDVAGNIQKDFTLKSSVVENEAITVTAVGSATSIRKAPIPITRVSKELLLSTSSTNIIDALSRIPGVSQVTTGPAISKPVIRGLGYNRVVVINDGVRQEGQQWGDEHGIEIDENSVSRVEVVKGPASIIYGSDALAGVVNIITTAPATLNTIKGNILTSYATNNRQRSLFANIGGNQNGFNWNAWGDLKAAADYSNKYDGRVWNSKFNEKNFGAYAGYNGSWGFSHFIFSRFDQRLGVIEGDRDDNGNFIKALPGGQEGNPTQDDFNSTTPMVPAQRVQHSKYTLDNSVKIGKGRISLNLALQRNQRQEFGNPDDPSEKNLYFDLQTFSYRAAYHFNDHGGWNTSLGLNGMAQGNQNKGINVLIPEYTLFDIGAYIYTQKTYGKATFSGGLRLDSRHLDSKSFMDGNDIKFEAFKKTFTNISASAGLSYAATEDVLFKLNVARGFRAPSIPELATNGTHEGTNRYEYGEKDLSSEISWQGDLGLELNTDHVLFTLTAFYNNINNFIFYSKLSNSAGGDSLVLVDGKYIQAFKFGQQDARLTGIEALLDLHPHPLDWLHWQNTFTYVNGRFKQAIEGTKNLPYIPAARFISQLRADLMEKSKSATRLSIFVEADHTFNQDNPFTAFNTETPTPGYTLVNAGFNANIHTKNKTLFSVYLMANNLTDVAYQNHLSRLKYTAENMATGRIGVFNMGRNFMVRVNIPLSFETK